MSYLKTVPNQTAFKFGYVYGRMSDSIEVIVKERVAKSSEKVRQMTGVELSLSIAYENPLYSSLGMLVFGHDCYSLLKLRSLTTMTN